MYIELHASSAFSFLDGASLPEALVDRAAELAAIATAGYEEGEYGILELLDAHRVTLGAGLRLLELSAAARRAAIELDRAIGQETTP